ncbi:transcription factor LRL1-like [Rutidosis leptorrhynchoides]|uniref:transcription factor LRL1-like n=1 Tax=Rutidosis leptorrhynchoides TaxID=125765 RepID=UPI003A9A616F
MPQNEPTAIDPIAGGTFSRLLFSDADDSITAVGFNNTTTDSHFTFSSDQKAPKMLCFGTDYTNNNNNINVASLSSLNSKTTTITDDNNNNSSSSPSSTTNSTTTSLSSNSNLKRNVGCDYYRPVVLPTKFTTTGTAVAPARTPRRNYKKTKVENSLPASHAKVKKENLGERIAALQQMVSPYGKTDTASVLHEAMGYIKFLQEQVQVLCSPYLKRLPTNQIVNDHVDGEKGKGGGERKNSLWSRGLCLVPVECTLHVAETNGADLWSPAAMVNRHGSSPLH